MSVLFTDIMTVYNFFRHPETEKEVWNRTIIKGVQWSHNKSEVSTSNGVQTESKVERITIDFTRAYGNKAYLPPNEYRKLSSEEVTDYWTLDAKTGQDMLVLGESNHEISRQYKLSDLQKDFQYAVTVTAVSDNRNRPRLKHIKAVGK
ncbi:hypothetical protein [Kineothrix sp. MB12-C1]|uniref:hypothetical protein n=1 Tax=Kineothrix sp. MB12-C1 TaxID=3070215 RepID=UPI0027D2D923|nr:hypothetical protein [Kineothrix sp. MB12-C1]WMC91257.1 hypothetical protein RBB56_10210 [Kineothrix sp. MB12-C1]